MMTRVKLTLASAVAAAALVAMPAVAQDGTVEMSETSNGGETPPPSPAAAGGYALKFAARPLTLSKMTLRGEFDFTLAKLPVIDPAVGIALGAAFGITDDLEVGATVVPLTLAPSAGYGDIPLYGRFRFLRGNFQLAGHLGLNIPTSTDFGLTPGVVGLFETNNLRLDFGVLVPLRFGDQLGKALNIPITVSYNFTDNLWAHIRTGVNLPNFDTLVIPLGFGGFYAVGKGNQPMLDLGVTFDWPLYLQTGGGDALVFDAFTIGVAARFHLFL